MRDARVTCLVRSSPLAWRQIKKPAMNFMQPRAWVTTQRIGKGNGYDHWCNMDPGSAKSYSCGSRAVVHLPGCPSGSMRTTVTTTTENQKAFEQPWYIKWRLALAAATIIPIGGVAYWMMDGSISGVSEVSDNNIMQINDDIFDTSDNLFVFFLDNVDEVVNRHEEMQTMVHTISGEPSLHRVRYYYNVRKEGDPPIPNSSNTSEGEGTSPKPKLHIVMYKGQRKTVLSGEIPKEQIINFFAPVSEDLKTAGVVKKDVPSVSGHSFPEDVVAASSPAQPVLLQLYEDTCFLCFLMRPFVNSLARLFVTYNVPLVIKRLNIEKNDFPDGCPVARGTPTFVCFRGEGMAPSKWDEFKPKELVEKISSEFPNHASEMYAKMDELQGMVSRRFQLFTQLVMWTLELHKLDALVSGIPTPQSGISDATATTEASRVSEDVTFNKIVEEMMAKDMKRTDATAENLEHLQKEVDEVEHDSALVGIMLAKSVYQRECAEEGKVADADL